MLPGASLSLIVAVALQQRAGQLGHFVDTGTLAGKESAAFLAAYGVVQCSLFDVLPQSDPRVYLVCQDLSR